MKQRTRSGQGPHGTDKNRKNFGLRGGAPSGRDRPREGAKDTEKSRRPAGKGFSQRFGAKDRGDQPRDAAAGDKFGKPQRKGRPFAPRAAADGRRDNARTDDKGWHPEKTGNPFSQRSGGAARRDKPRAAPRGEEKFDRFANKSKTFGQRRPAPSRDDTRGGGDSAFRKPAAAGRAYAPRTHAKPRPQQAIAAPAVKTPREGILLWGVHAVREALLNPRRHCFNLWVTEAAADNVAEILATATEKGLRRPVPVNADRDTLNQMLPPSTVHQGIVLEAALLPEMTLHDALHTEPPPDLVIVLDQVTDPHNVGAILRSAAAFGAGAVIMTERNAPTTTGVMAKTASGAAEHVPQIHVVNLARALTELQQAGYWCVGLAEEGERDLSALDLSGRTALVFGAEGDGLRRLTREHCDELARLPTGGAIGSLNVSNAAAVALYEVRRQKGKFA